MKHLGISGMWVKNTDDSFILLPEIMTRIGSTYILLGDPKNASEAFAKARAVKPDYWPAYTHWAEYLQAKGAKKEAMELVKIGLQYAPNAKVLLSLFRTLGGKPGDIPLPIQKKEPTLPKESSSDQQPIEDSAPATNSSEKKP